MRKLFLVLLAVLFITGTALAATSGNRTSPGRGEIVQMPYPSDPPKKFRLVRWSGTAVAGSTIAANSIVVWDTTVDDGVSVNTSVISHDSSVAGIVVTTILSADVTDNTAIEDIGKDNWGWLQTYGISTVNLAAGSAAVSAGSAMSVSSTKAEAGAFVASASDSTANGYAGFFFDADAVGTDEVECFVKTE